MAKQGRGSYSLVTDNKDLKSIVIRSLARAKDPSFSNCKFNFTPTPIIKANNMKLSFEDTSKGYELFRNEIFLFLAIVNKQDF